MSSDINCPNFVPAAYDSNTPAPAKFYDRALCVNDPTYNRSMEVHPGQTRLYVDQPGLPGLGSLGWDNAISSAVVPPNTSVTVYADQCLNPNHKDFPGQPCTKHTFGPGRYDHLGHIPYGEGRDPNHHMDNNITEIVVNNIVPHKTWLTNCCLGKVAPVSDCANFANRSGSECKNLLRVHCSDPNNFFQTGCKEWMQELDAELKNTVAKEVCSKATTNAQKEWCACWDLSEIPEEYKGDPAIERLWPCLDPVCNNTTKALQPYRKNEICPSVLTICNQRDITTKLAESEIGTQRLENSCGNVYLEGDGEEEAPPFVPTPTAPPTTPTPPQAPLTPASPASPFSTWNNLSVPVRSGIIGGSIFFFILLIGIIIAVVRRRR